MDGLTMLGARHVLNQDPMRQRRHLRQQANAGNQSHPEVASRAARISCPEKHRPTLLGVTRPPPWVK
jgi:hypothetical protein